MGDKIFILFSSYKVCIYSSKFKEIRSIIYCAEKYWGCRNQDWVRLGKTWEDQDLIECLVDQYNVKQYYDKLNVYIWHPN